MHIAARCVDTRNLLSCWSARFASANLTSIASESDTTLDAARTADAVQPSRVALRRRLWAYRGVTPVASFGLADNTRAAERVGRRSPWQRGSIPPKQMPG